MTHATHATDDASGTWFFYALALVLIAILATAFFTLGLPGVTLVMVTLTPVMYILILAFSAGL